MNDRAARGRPNTVVLEVHVEELLQRDEPAMGQGLQRERCQVAPKDASWPTHPGGNTAVKG